MQLPFWTTHHKQTHESSFKCFGSFCAVSHFFSSSLSVCISPFPCPIYTFLSACLLACCPWPDIQKKQPGEDCTSKPIQSTGSSQSPVFSSETSSSSSQSLLSSPPSSSEQPSAEEPSPTFPSMREGKTEQPVTSTPRKTKSCWWRTDCLFSLLNLLIIHTEEEESNVRNVAEVRKLFHSASL